MWVVIFIAGIIALFMSALLIAYLNLRDTVKSMKQSVKEVTSLNDQLIELNNRLIELNNQLCSELYDNKEDDNNECE